jgi:uncharacterized protein (DUF983 family)
MGHTQSWIIEFSFHKFMFRQSVNAAVHIVLFCQDARMLELINPSAWGHLNRSSYCDVGRLFTGYLNYGLNCREKKMKK